MDMQELNELVLENAVLKDKIDSLSGIQNEVKKQLKVAITELGEVSENGHVVVELDHEIEGISKVMNQKRVSKNLDIDVAEALLTEKGIHERCIQMIPVLNEDEIMAAYYEGLITEEDIDKMFPAKVTWALVMSKA
jgi:predicted RNA-binding protein associated with RNAse of E/G family